MPNDVDLWVRSAQADFQAASHQGARISDLYAMNGQIEEMLQSVALGLNELTEALRLMSNRIDHIESWVQAQQTLQQQERPAQRESRILCAVTG